MEARQPDLKTLIRIEEGTNTKLSNLGYSSGGKSFTEVCYALWCRERDIGRLNGRVTLKIDKVPQGRFYQTIKNTKYKQIGTNRLKILIPT